MSNEAQAEQIALAERRAATADFIPEGVSHYPLAPGQVVVRWRGGQDPDERGYIVEANIGGVIMEGAGHYGASLLAAREEGDRIAAAIARATTTGE